MDAIDKAGAAVEPPRLRPASPPVASPAPATPVAPRASATEAANLISLLADAQPPVDSKKVEAIQSLIASGTYPIDAHAIAAKMLALDFPERGASADA